MRYWFVNMLRAFIRFAFLFESKLIACLHKSCNAFAKSIMNVSIAWFVDFFALCWYLQYLFCSTVEANRRWEIDKICVQLFFSLLWTMDLKMICELVKGFESFTLHKHFMVEISNVNPICNEIGLFTPPTKVYRQISYIPRLLLKTKPIRCALRERFVLFSCQIANVSRKIGTYIEMFGIFEHKFQCWRSH